jgi:hypothetical protein
MRVTIYINREQREQKMNQLANPIYNWYTNKEVTKLGCRLPNDKPSNDKNKKKIETIKKIRAR